MKYVLYILFVVNLVFGNEELDSYINNDNLKQNIIKDEKYQRIIIDLLDNKNKMIIFNKNKNDNYKKAFDEKIYFCEDSNIIFFKSILIKEKLLKINCFSNFVDEGQFSLDFYFNISGTLQQIRKEYFTDMGVSKVLYKFIPKDFIPRLKNFTNKSFSEQYLNINSKNFIEVNYISSNNNKTIQPKRQPLYKTPPEKTKMDLIKGDKVEILEEKDDWIYILYKGKKDIKAWIPKSAVE